MLKMVEKCVILKPQALTIKFKFFLKIIVLENVLLEI